MSSILYKNEHLSKVISKFVDAVRSISANHLAEGRCGSMFLDITDCMPEDSAEKVSISPEYEIGEELKNLKHRFFYSTASKCSFEQFVHTPMEFSSIIRILDNCRYYEAIADNLVKFPEEMLLALKVFNDFPRKKDQFLTISHTYPMDLELAMRKINFDTEKFIELGQEYSPDQTWTFKKGFVTVKKDQNDNFINEVSSAIADKKNVYIPKYGLYTFGVEPLAASDKIIAINHIAKIINNIF